MNTRLCRYLFPLAALALTGCGGKADDDADAANKVSADVTTQAVHQGSLPDIVSAYGTAAPAIDAASTLSIQAEGAVTQFDVTAGTAVHRGQRLLTFTLSPAAAAVYQQARTALTVARAAREHTAQLLAHQLATRDQLAQADKTASDARSALDAMRNQQGDGRAMELLAPFDGIVSSIAATRGDILQPGAALLSLARRGGAVVSVGIEPDPRHAAAPGDKVTLVPLGAGAPVTGTVLRVSGMLDAHTHLQNADIAPDGAVMVGMGYRADITVDQWRGWLLPRDALAGDATHLQVFQVADGKAVKVPVTVVGQSDTEAVVSGVLDAQRPLVVVGNTQLDDGMAVRTAKPAVPTQ
jgi:RND family efflux transporter MFP subunit